MLSANAVPKYKVLMLTANSLKTSSTEQPSQVCVCFVSGVFWMTGRIIHMCIYICVCVHVSNQIDALVTHLESPKHREPRERYNQN